MLSLEEYPESEQDKRFHFDPESDGVELGGDAYLNSERERKTAGEEDNVHLRRRKSRRRKTVALEEVASRRRKSRRRNNS
ncbi:hypothetical protein LXL04_017114 [Taraxacum kok-saghyz]